MHLYKDPQGTTVLDEDEQSIPKLQPLTQQSIFSNPDKEDEIVKLRRRVAVLEKAQGERAQTDQAVKVEEVAINTALAANQESASVRAIH